MKERTEALSIPQGVKREVAKRDSCDGWPCCVLCGKPAPTRNYLAFSNAHYISRAQGGLGIVENILTLCPGCHRDYDGDKRNDLKPILRIYLANQHDGWDEKKLKYRRKKDAE